MFDTLLVVVGNQKHVAEVLMHILKQCLELAICSFSYIIDILIVLSLSLWHSLSLKNLENHVFGGFVISVLLFSPCE